MAMATSTTRASSRMLTRALSSSSSPSSSSSSPNRARPPHLLSLADLSVPQLDTLLESAHRMKSTFKAHQVPREAQAYGLPLSERELLKGRTVALMFSKRSTRTRVASESATALLGGSESRLGEGMGG